MISARGRNRGINRKWESKMKGSRMADRIIRRVDNPSHKVFTDEQISLSPLSMSTLNEISKISGYNNYQYWMLRLNVVDYSTFEGLSAHLEALFENNKAYNTNKSVQDDIEWLLKKVWDWQEEFLVNSTANELNDLLAASGYDREVAENYGYEESLEDIFINF